MSSFLRYNNTVRKNCACGVWICIATHLFAQHSYQDTCRSGASWSSDERIMQPTAETLIPEETGGPRSRVIFVRNNAGRRTIGNLYFVSGGGVQFRPGWRGGMWGPSPRKLESPRQNIELCRYWYRLEPVLRYHSLSWIENAFSQSLCLPIFLYFI